MKKRKNNIFSLVVIVIIAIIISFISNNYNLLFIDNRGNAEINLNKIEYEDKKIVIPITNYVNKLVIKYDAKENIDFNVEYFGKDVYEKDTKNTINDGFDSKLHTSVIYLKEEIDEISLTFNQDYANIISINSVTTDNSFSFSNKKFAYILALLLTIYISILYFKGKIFSKKIEKFVLSITLIVGMTYIFTFPRTTGVSWDDQIHYSAIYQIVEFDGNTQWYNADSLMKNVVPISYIDNEDETKIEYEYLNSLKGVEFETLNSPFISYTHIGYIIPGIVMKICLMLGIPFTLKIILTKMASLLFYSLLVYIAIKIIPRGKKVISLISLLPINIFLATQFSYDSPITAGIILFMALLIKFREDNSEKINFKYTILFIISIILFSFIKAIYAPLILLVLFIPKTSFENSREHKHFKLGMMLIMILMIFTFIVPNAGSDVSGDERVQDTSISGQISNIKSHPFGYIEVLKNTAGNSFVAKLISKETFIDYAYLNGNVNISYNYYYIILFLMTIALIYDSYKIKDENRKTIKWVYLILLLAVVLLIWTALYLSYNSVGSLDIAGVQNRYFVPLLVPSLLLLFTNKSIKCSFDEKSFEAIMVLFMACILLVLGYQA